MTRHLLCATALLLATAACQTTATDPALAAAPAPAATAASAQATAQIQGQLAGKTLTNADSTLALTKDGALIGKSKSGAVIRGTWEAKDGKFCRTLTEPAAAAGTECQNVTIQGDQLTLVRANGQVVTYTLN